MDVIETHDLTKHYGDVVGLEGLDVTVAAGEVFGFLGPNGAGKTTTIRLLMGFLTATRGTARVLGRDAFDDAVAVHRRVGYLPSDPAYPAALTGRAYLEHLARLRGGVDPARVRELRERFEADLDRPLTDLSRGNRQKIGVIQAFMHDPDLVVLDEASTGLDPLKQAALNRLVRRVAADGRAVFLSSHLISEVEQVADRVGIVRDGRLVALETVEGLRARAVRRAEVRFAEPVEPVAFEALPDVSEVTARGDTLRMTVTGSMDALVKEAARHTVVSFTSHEADLAEVFLGYYRRDDAAGQDGAAGRDGTAGRDDAAGRDAGRGQAGP